MSNILIIKHGSLGDLIQANGAIKDIKNFYQNRKVFLLTAQPYAIFMSECPYIDGVIIDSEILGKFNFDGAFWELLPITSQINHLKLDLKMGLGEGSGAATALPIFRSALAAYNNMATFAFYNIAKSQKKYQFAFNILLAI